MNRSSCPTGQQLIDFCIGKLPDPEIDAVAEHLDACSHCRATVEALEKVPIPFVEYYLSQPGNQTPGSSVDPQFRSMLSRLKDLCSQSPNSSG